MSSTAVGWALRVGAELSPATRLVLILLADYASAEGAHAFPTRATIVERTGVSDATARRALRELEAAGYITRGDQDLVAHYRADRRPVVWDMVLTRGVTVTGRQDDGASSSTPRGVIPFATGGHDDPQTKNLTKNAGGRAPERAREAPEPVPDPPKIESPKNDEPDPDAELASSLRRPDRCDEHQGMAFPPPCGACADRRKEHERRKRRGRLTTARTPTPKITDPHERDIAYGHVRAAPMPRGFRDEIRRAREAARATASQD